METTTVRGLVFVRKPWSELQPGDVFTPYCYDSSKLGLNQGQYYRVATQLKESHIRPDGSTAPVPEGWALVRASHVETGAWSEMTRYASDTTWVVQKSTVTGATALVEMRQSCEVDKGCIIWLPDTDQLYVIVDAAYVTDDEVDDFVFELLQISKSERVDEPTIGDMRTIKRRDTDPVMTLTFSPYDVEGF